MQLWNKQGLVCVCVCVCVCARVYVCYVSLLLVCMSVRECFCQSSCMFACPCVCLLVLLTCMCAHLEKMNEREKEIKKKACLHDMCLDVFALCIHTVRDESKFLCVSALQALPCPWPTSALGTSNVRPPLFILIILECFTEVKISKQIQCHELLW